MSHLKLIHVVEDVIPGNPHRNFDDIPGNPHSLIARFTEQKYLKDMIGTKMN